MPSSTSKPPGIVQGPQTFAPSNYKIMGLPSSATSQYWTANGPLSISKAMYEVGDLVTIESTECYYINNITKVRDYYKGKRSNIVSREYTTDYGWVYSLDIFQGDTRIKLLERCLKLVKVKYDGFNIDRLNTQINKLNKMADAKKQFVKKSTKEVRVIETSLINKEEVFKMLGLAEATGLPCLLIGDPGVAKTKTVLEYAKAWLNKDGKMTAQDFANKIYILETDEGTKASEIKGMPDLGKLFTDNKYELNAPIAEAEIIIINEVDKASSAIRNAMLGVMNEKFLFNGKNKIPCKWKLFVATCNEIPKEESDSPFWDRFMLKMTVNRVSAGELVKYYNKGARNYKETFKINIPDSAEIESVNIIVNKLEKYLEVGYTHSSDRTLTFVPRLAKAVSYIWDVSIDKALVKTAQIMIGQSAGSELQNKLMSAEVKAVMSKVEMLHSYTTNDQLELAIAEIENLINTYTKRNIIDSTQVEEIEMSIQYLLQSHPARKDYNSSEDFDNLMSELEGTSQDSASTI